MRKRKCKSPGWGTPKKQFNKLSLKEKLALHETTSPERIFLETLISRLNFIDKTYEIQHNAVVAYNGDFRRPDFLIPELGLVIEVDGVRHQCHERQMRSDKEREHFYKNLDLNLMVIQNEDVKFRYSRNRVMNLLIQFANTQELSTAKLNDLKAKIELHRSNLADVTPDFKEIFALNLEKMNPVAVIGLDGVSRVRYFAGFKLNIPPKNRH